MAPLPVENTARYWVTYRANAREHVTMFRYDDGGLGGLPPGAFITGVGDFLDACATIMPTDFAVLSARYAESGSVVSLPALPPVLSLAGAITPNTAEAPAFVDWLGRGPSGRRVRVTLLGAGVSPANEGAAYGDYRATAGEFGWVTATLTELVNLGNVTIAGDVPLWQNYCNLGYNAYWQKAVRT